MRIALRDMNRVGEMRIDRLVIFKTARLYQYTKRDLQSNSLVRALPYTCVVPRITKVLFAPFHTRVLYRASPTVYVLAGNPAITSDGCAAQSRAMAPASVKAVIDACIGGAGSIGLGVYAELKIIVFICGGALVQSAAYSPEKMPVLYVNGSQAPVSR